MCIWLDMLGADVVGISLDPLYEGGIFDSSGIGNRMKDYRADIRDLDKVLEIFAAEQPEIVFHLAAQPLVLTSYQNPVETFATNTQGTAHILEAIRLTESVRAGIMITTDKCYENQEWVYGYRETDPMGGHDPYSASKGAAEIVISSFRRSFFGKEDTAAIASARAGNVIGGGDWSDYRLIPDIIRSVERGDLLEIRSPKAVRPWQHVLEPIGGYLQLGERLLEDKTRYADAWNFGPLSNSVRTVAEMVDAFLRFFGKGDWKDVSDPNRPHEAGLLMLDISKAMQQLQWQPVLSFEETVRYTAEWYAQYRNTDALALTQEQIKNYIQLWKSRNASSPELTKSALHPA